MSLFFYSVPYFFAIVTLNRGFGLYKNKTALPEGREKGHVNLQLSRKNRMKRKVQFQENTQNKEKCLIYSLL